MSFVIDCQDALLINKQVKQFNQCYTGPLDGRIASLLITGPGVKIPCYKDQVLIDDYLSQSDVYEAGHPLVGAGSVTNPNAGTADLLFRVEGEIPEPSANTTESSRSFDAPSQIVDYDWAPTITTYYHPDNKRRIDEIANGQWGELFITLLGGVGFKVPNNPTLSPLTFVDTDELILKFSISFTTKTGVLPWQQVPEILLNNGKSIWA